MTLLEAIQQLKTLDDDNVLFAVKPWIPSSPALVLEDDPDGGTSHGNYSYVLEVFLAREVVEVWEEWHSRSATADDALRAIVHYGVHDAYLDETGTVY